jgi:hypothetical protein
MAVNEVGLDATYLFCVDVLYAVSFNTKQGYRVEAKRKCCSLAGLLVGARCG